MMSSINILDAIGVCIFLAGFVVGLGAVTVIIGGGLIFYRHEALAGIPLVHAVSALRPVHQGFYWTVNL